MTLQSYKKTNNQEQVLDYQNGLNGQLDQLTTKVQKKAPDIKKKGYSILFKRWSEYLKLKGVLSPSDKRFNDIYLFRLVYRDSPNKLKLIKDYESLSDKDKLIKEEKTYLNQVIRTLSLNVEKKIGGAIINRIRDFIKQTIGNNEEPFDFGLAWNEIAIFDKIKWESIDQKDFYSFVTSYVVPSLGISSTDIGGSEIVIRTINNQFILSGEFNKTHGIDRKKLAKKIAFLDGTLDSNTLKFEPIHSPEDYLYNCLIINYSDFEPLLQKEGEPFEDWLNRVKEWTKVNAPKLFYYIETTFKSWIDFINLNEHVVLSLTEIPINLRMFYMKGHGNSGKSTIIELVIKAFEGFATMVNARKALSGKDTERGDEYCNAGSSPIFCDPDISKERFNEEHLKKGISNEGLRGRKLFKQSEEHEITIRYLVASNHVLNVDNAGYETKRRIYPIELNAIPEEDIDKRLTSELLKYPKEFQIVSMALGYSILKRPDYEYTYNPNVKPLLDIICGNVINQFVNELEIEPVRKVEVWYKKEPLYRAFTIYCKKSGVKNIPDKRGFLNDLDSALRAGYPIIGGAKKKRLYVPEKKGEIANVVKIKINNIEDYDSLLSE